MSLIVKDISFSYDIKLTIKDINFCANKGEMLAVLGKNGSGKSTLIKTINYILSLPKGAVYIDGKSVNSFRRNDIAKKIAHMPQKTSDVNVNVFESVLLGRKPHIRWDASKKDCEITENILKLMDMEDLAHRNTLELSGGEFQKMLIARALAQEPEIMLLDEPINHLDLKNQIEVMELLQDITQKFDMTTIVVLHDINMAMRFADKFIMLKKGEMVAFGGKEVMTPDNIKKVYDINVVITEVKGIPLGVPI